LASGGGTFDRCIRFWNTLTGQSAQHIDTGSQVTNLAWSKFSSELVSFLQSKVVLNFVAEMVFLTKVRKDFLLYLEQAVKNLKMMKLLF
jgi:WD40 repeat protein